ncbi:MAG TPA: hypothetical protein VGB55_16210 [Tepidisphaeraceae bacterium]|jgi:hypothetical protein
MGVAIYISLERELDGHGPSDIDGKALAAGIETVDEICERRGVVPLTAMVSTTTDQLAEYGFDEDGTVDTTLAIEDAKRSLDDLKALGGTTAEDFADLQKLVEAAEADTPVGPVQTHWFDANSGLTSVDAAISELESQPKAGRQNGAFPTTQDLLDDLVAARGVLLAAQKAAVRFHFSFDF